MRERRAPPRDDEEPMTAEGSLNQKVVAWARGKLKKRVRRGQCWDLADQAVARGIGLTADAGDSLAAAGL
jgi:hypothetical protein